MKFIVKGIFVDTPSYDELRIRDGELLIENNKIKEFRNHFNLKENIKVYDFSGRIILPGFTDLHLHAPQYSQCGMAMDTELITWLNKYTYPLEKEFEDNDYAFKEYTIFVNDLIHSPSTRFSIFASLHTDATLILMDLIEKSGLVAYVGKLNMNRNCPEYYTEGSTINGMMETMRWLYKVSDKNYKNVYPIITPRFTPSCTDDYMEKLGKLVNEKKLPVQSHLDENKDEINWVKALCPDALNYAETYNRYGLFGSTKTIMAHCIYPNEDELRLIKKNSVYIAHCPTSNENVIAGICPAAYYLRNGYSIGLGSDVAGGETLDLFEVMKESIRASKLYYKYVSDEYKPLNITEELYMATLGGGKFFGKVGLFEDGYDFDSIVLEDAALNVSIRNYSIEERLERFIYLGHGKVSDKFVKGEKIL